MPEICRKLNNLKYDAIPVLMAWVVAMSLQIQGFSTSHLLNITTAIYSATERRSGCANR